MNDTITAAGAPHAVPIPDTVIAKYALGRMCFSFVATLAAFAAGWAVTFQHPAGAGVWDYAWATNKVMIITMFFCTLLAVWRFGMILGQVIHHGGRAVWIENGRLRYLAYGVRSYSCVPLGDVQDVSTVPGGVFRPTRIAIRARGDAEYITPFFLSATADAIQARLVEALVNAGVHTSEACAAAV